MRFQAFDDFWREIVEEGFHQRDAATPAVALRCALETWRTCAICNLASVRAFRVIAKWQFALAEDPEVQAEFVAHETWCNRHAWRFVDITGPHGLGQIHQHLLSAIVGRLRSIAADGARGVLGQPPSQWLEQMVGGRQCPLCEDEAALEAVLLGELHAGLLSGDLRPAFEHSGGCCLPHLARLLAHIDDAQLAAFLLCHTESRLRRLSEELAIYHEETVSRRRAYGPTRDAPARAMATWAGLRGTVGSLGAAERLPVPAGQAR